MSTTAVDVMGFAGGMTLGMVQAGFTLVGKRELKGGFGVPNCEANRHLLGHAWKAQVGPPEQWETVPDTDVVFGNPPCSGFSLMTDKKHRGVDAKINSCMWSFVEFAARSRPTIAVFESVRQAFSGGRALMQALRAKLEETTGLRYDLYHVMHNAYDLGGAAVRPRYFWVASQVPFGVTYPTLIRRPKLRDVIGDLEGLSNTWEAQPYQRTASWWSASVRSDTYAVDGHVTRYGLATQRALQLLDLANEKLNGWPPNWHIGQMAKYAWEHLNELPPLWSHMIDKLIKIDFHMGFTSLTRWDMDRPGRVITGGALNLVLHPTENRTITHRETARVMGFPDDWKIKPLRGYSALPLTWGKGITVQCGRWIGTQVLNSLHGVPGEVIGELIGERERLIRPVKDSIHPRTGVVATQTRVAVHAAQPKSDIMNTRFTHQDGGMKRMTAPEGAPAPTPEATATEAPSTGGGRRGRPRSDDTLKRDASVLEQLRAGEKTREELATALDETPNLVYLSLYRLRRSGQVERRRNDKGAHVWGVTAA